jgi:hypothetical protein
MKKQTKEIALAFKIPREEKPLWEKVALFRGYKNLHQFLKSVTRLEFNKALGEIVESAQVPESKNANTSSSTVETAIA